MTLERTRSESSFTLVSDAGDGDISENTSQLTISDADVDMSLGGEDVAQTDATSPPSHPQLTPQETALVDAIKLLNAGFEAQDSITGLRNSWLRVHMLMPLNIRDSLATPTDSFASGGREIPSWEELQQKHYYKDYKQDLVQRPGLPTNKSAFVMKAIGEEFARRSYLDMESRISEMASGYRKDSENWDSSMKVCALIQAFANVTTESAYTQAAREAKDRLKAAYSDWRERTLELVSTGNDPANLEDKVDELKRPDYYQSVITLASALVAATKVELVAPSAKVE